VCDFSRLAVTDWRLWFLALMTGTQLYLTLLGLSKGGTQAKLRIFDL